MWIRSIAKLRSFLRRVAKFSTSYFVLLNVQELPSEHQEVIFNFISRPERADTFNLHCVQLTDTILHASPWIKSKLWRNDKVESNSRDLQKWVTRNVLHSNIFDRITVVSSPMCGTGKTRYILQELSQIRSNDPNTRIATISIHEKSSIESLVESLLTKFDGSNQNNAVFFSFMIRLGPQQKKLMNMLNYFFQSLFLTGSVHDPQNEVTFYLGVGRWTVFVELEGVDGTRSDSTDKSLTQYIPILGYCSSFESPPHQYQVDDKAQRVSTYLRAYDNGTIDRKFDSSSSKKQLMFVIDKSGSMASMMGTNTTALDIAIDNAVEIFNSHVKVDDVSK